MRIFIIGSVRNASDSEQDQLLEYARLLEDSGNIVHLPQRDTFQDARGVEICRQNAAAIRRAHEVHVVYSSKSQGTHFDLGVAFALGKPLVIAENEPFGPGKSYARMLHEWEVEGP